MTAREHDRCVPGQVDRKAVLAGHSFRADGTPEDPHAYAERACSYLMAHGVAEAVCRRLGLSRADGEDVLQQTLCTLMAPRTARRHADHWDDLGGWIYTVVLRHALTLRRQQRRQRTVDLAPALGLDSGDRGPLEQLECAELVEAIHDALDELPEAEREEVLDWMALLGEDRQRARNGTPRTGRARMLRLRGKRRLAATLAARGFGL